MADLKISQLTGATTPLAGTEVVPVVQSGATKKVSVADLTAGRSVGMLESTAGNIKVSANTINATNTNGGLDINANGTGRANVQNTEVKGSTFNVNPGATVTVTIAGVIFGQMLIGFGAYASAGEGYLHRLLSIGGFQAAGVAFYDVATLASASHANTVLGAVTKGASSVTFTITNNGSQILQCAYHYTYCGQANNTVVTIT